MIVKPVLATTVAMVLAFGAPAAVAQDVWLRNGKTYTGPDVAQTGDFGVWQVATVHPNEFMTAWNRPGAGVPLVASDKVARNQPVVTFIIFRGCRPDPRGACNVTADFTVVAPDGRVYNETKGADVWIGRPPPTGRNIELSAGALGLRIEDKDLLGAYVIKAAVTDHVAGVTLQTEKTITAQAD